MDHVLDRKSSLTRIDKKQPGDKYTVSRRNIHCYYCSYCTGYPQISRDTRFPTSLLWYHILRPKYMGLPNTLAGRGHNSILGRWVGFSPYINLGNLYLLRLVLVHGNSESGH